MQSASSDEPVLGPDSTQPSPPPAAGGAPKLKLRWGRERPPGAPGDRLLPRLGPGKTELAPFHNHLPSGDGLAPPQSDGQPPRIPLETPLEMVTYVALDCETTGHFPDRMVELGAVRFRLPAPPEHPRLLLETLVHTTDHINPYARRVHGISRTMLTGAPSLRRVAAAFHGFAQGAILVEHSADSFDTRLISKAMDRPLPKHHLDTSRLAGFLFQLRDTIGLERLCERLGVTHRQPHFALADAEATADCFVRLVQLGQTEFGWRTLGDLVTVAMPPAPRPLIRGPRRDGATTSDAVATPASARGTRRRHRGGRRRRPEPAAPGAEPEA